MRSRRGMADCLRAWLCFAYYHAWLGSGVQQRRYKPIYLAGMPTFADPWEVLELDGMNRSFDDCKRDYDVQSIEPVR